jgi:hypothetical protein
MYSETESKWRKYMKKPCVKRKTKILFWTMDELFKNEVLSKVGDAKIADVWSVESVWGILREKVPRRQFWSLEQL